MQVTEIAVILAALLLAGCGRITGEMPVCTQQCTITKSWGVI